MFKTTIDTSIRNFDFTFEVEYDYVPEIESIMYHRDGSGSPAEPEEFILKSITYNGKKLNPKRYSNIYEFIEEELYESVDGNECLEYLEDFWDSLDN